MNTIAAEVLYDQVRQLLNPTRMTTVLDVCCGTGTHGLMAAGTARGVVGIELSKTAVEDARFNASLNGIHNAEFYAGPVEKLLEPVLKEMDMCPDISAVINPARSGVRKLKPRSNAVNIFFIFF